MKARHLILAFGVAVLLAPAAMLAAEPEIKPEAKAVEKTKSAQCERAAGSYLRSTAKDCKTTTPDRVYTPDDLERTGVRDTNAALRKIDQTYR